MLILPFSGWAMISANPPPGSAGAAYADSLRKPEPTPPGHAVPQPKRPTMVWWAVPLPMITPLRELGRTPEGVPAQRAKRKQIGEFHEAGGWVMLALLLLHVAGALKHQFLDKEEEFARMGLGRRRAWQN
jgi:cytochrome b561